MRKKDSCRIGYLSRLTGIREILISVSCEIVDYDNGIPMYSKSDVMKLKKTLEEARQRKINLDNDLAKRGLQSCLRCGRLISLNHRLYCDKCQNEVGDDCSTIQD